MKIGFTLIELLVVVLIISILAAIALPQYQKAVWKSEAAILKQKVLDIAMAQELYFLTNGDYASSMDQLDWNGSINDTNPKCIDGEGKSEYQICVEANKNIHTKGVFTEGLYADAGFRYVHKKTSSQYVEKKLYCVEPYKAGWEGGKFCSKLLSWKYVDGADGMRIYRPD